MDDTTADLFLTMSITFGFFGICYHYLIIRYKERTAIVEKGLPKDFFKGSTNYLPLLLLLAIVSISIGLGLLAGAFLESVAAYPFKGFMLPFAMLLFLGISLLISYYVLRKLDKNNKA